MQIKKFSRVFSVGLLAVALAATLVPAAGVAAPSAQAQDVLIQFEGTPGASEEALVQRFGGTVNHTFHLVPAIAARVPERSLTGLAQHPAVTVIEPDGQVFALDAELDNTWGVKRIGAGTVHADGNQGTGVKVAVIDTGVDYTHSELDAYFAGGYDFVNDDSDPMDDHGHGTHVSGTVAGEDNDEGVVGAGPEISVYGLKVLSGSGSGSWSDIIAAVEWAVDNGIQATNNSYGSGSDPGSTVKAAFDNAAAAGVLHIAAAGNSGNPPGKGDNVGYPARYDSVVATAATNKDDSRASFSSTGEDVELAAPGVDINSALLGGGYGEKSGTSMASPHVAGTAALVIAAGIADANGDGNVNDEVRSVLQSTAEDLGSTGRDTRYGYGLVDADAAVAAVGPADPAVNVTLSTDKSEYVSGEDTTAVLTAVVSDENSDPISGLDASAFATTVDGSAVSVTFSETATAGTYTGNLDISGLAAGTHTVEVTVTDTRGVSGSDSASFSIADPVTDIAVTAVNAPASVTQGDVVSVDVTVENVGNQDVGSDITVTLHDDTDAVSIGSQTISGGLVAGESATLTFSWDTSSASLGDHVLTASHNVSDDDSTNDSASTTVTVNDSADTMHVGDLDAVKDVKGKSGNWEVLLTVTVHDSNENPVSGADVTVSVSGAISGTATGTTGSDGTVTFTTGTMKGGSEVTFTVDNVTHTTLTYASADNHDPDGDSDGTTITVVK